MCGIAGKVYTNSKDKILQADILKMTQSLAHRGPDDEGIRVFGHAGLGNRRLAIIDLSQKGHQPMSNAKKTIWITFNGEIFNYSDLRDLLIKKGYKFFSHSDTEVIIALYEKFGTDCLKYLRGQFSFALYDLKKDLLFAARDRIGQNPFKYFFDGRTFIFASEIKAILTQPEVKKEIDEDALREYIYWGLVPAPKTGFKNIFKLPAAHFLTFHKGKLTIKKYWDYSPVVNPNLSSQDAIENVRKLVTDSVKLRMVSDVPVGAFLSGGIDSCVVVGLMSRHSLTKIKTYTIGFKGWPDNESNLAKISAKYHQTDHYQEIVTPNIKSILPKVVRAYDEPFGDVSAIPSFYVSKLVGGKLKVVLNGDGGDENFLGYSNYETAFKIRNLHSLAPFFFAAYTFLKPWQNSFYGSNLYQRTLRIADIMRHNQIGSYAQFVRGYLNFTDYQNLFVKKSLDSENELKKYLPKNASDFISAIFYMDLHHILPDGLMTKMDIATMHHSLEARSPLLDHKLIEFTSTIPINLKYRHGQTKYIFRQAFKDLIPSEINRQPKRGFVMPVGKWLKKELRPLLNDALGKRSAFVYQFLSFDQVQKILNYHQQTEIDFSSIIWRILMLELWYQEFFA